MSYNSPPSNGPEGQWYDDYGIPAYHEQGSKRLQKNRAPQQEYVQYQQQYAADPRMRFPRPQAYPRAQQMDTRDLYDDTDYADYETDQWPLSAQPVPRQEPPPRRPNGSRPPPRPQRPDYVPPNVEPPRSGPRAAPAIHSPQQPPMQQPPRSHQPPNPRSQLPSQQFHHGTGQWTGEGYSIPTQASGLPSHGNPIPQQASYTKMPPRPPLGPPPSSRRGPSSYYSQQLSPVHPIVEEAESSRHSHSRSSLTSSNAIPIGIPKFYLDGRESGVSVTPESENAPANSPPRPEPPLRPFKQRMQEAVADDYFMQQRGESPSEGNVPVRQASLGRRSKPTLTHVKSGDRMRKRSSSLADVGLNVQDQDQQVMPTGPRQVTETNDKAVVGADFDESPTAPPMPSVHRAGATDPGDSFFDSSSGSGRSTQARGAQIDSPAASVSVVNRSDEHLGLPKKQQQQQHHVHGRSPLAHDDDDDDDDYDDAFAKEAFTDPEKRRDLARKDSDTLKAPTDGFSGLRAGKRRPPRLNVDAIKDEEARGSLTSLSDLIKRATRLASNLDRGRTASRLGMEHFLAAGNGEGNEKTRRSAASLSDILNSFPPPGAATPQGENRSLNNWGSRRQSAPLPSNSDVASNTRKQRRCCGIPLWLFVLLVIILILLVAAATVIPIVLVVIPNQNSESSSNNQASTGTQASTLSQCSESLICENGGQAFPSSESEDTCRCVCVNSFTGPTCSTKSTAGCSSLTIPDMDDDATVGDAIPRLVNMADDEYSIPLDARAILGLFNEADLSCAAENALVSFNGKAQRRLRRELPSVPTPVKRSPQASEPSVHPAEATSNGIVFDSRPSPVEHSVSPASATTTSSPSPSASSSSKLDLDFARAAVLYILQDSASLQDAEGAQKALQQAFDAGKGAGVVAVGGGEWQVDLGKKVLKKGGEQVGGDGQ